MLRYLACFVEGSLVSLIWPGFVVFYLYLIEKYMNICGLVLVYF